MVIKGFQKLTLLDFPGRVAATVFTPGCDFRCPFCHNASLVLDRTDVLEDPQQIKAFLKERFGRLTGVAITGGEPMMQQGLEEFMKDLKDMGYAVKLDTNGSFPGRLRRVIEEGLCDYVAMDIKNGPSGYARTSGLPESSREGLLANIEESIAILRENKVDHEFRTTVVRQLHSPQDIEEMGRWMVGDDKFFLQGFKDSGDLLQPGLTGYSAEEMAQLLSVFKAFVPRAELRGV